MEDIPPRRTGRGLATEWLPAVLSGQPVFVADIDPREAGSGSRAAAAIRLGLRLHTRLMSWQGREGCAVWTEPAT